MKTVGSYEAKMHLPRLLNEVAAGETITKHGKPVAQLIPSPDAQRTDVDTAIADWLEYRRRENVTLDGLSIKEMIEEGRM